jgi:hypothetical protein
LRLEAVRQGAIGTEAASLGHSTCGRKTRLGKADDDGWTLEELFTELERFEAAAGSAGLAGNSVRTYVAS